MDDRAGYDVFISYTRSKAQWDREHLAGPLSSCRTADGRIPRVFLDTESLHAGVDFLEQITDCIKRSSVSLLVFSRDYFASKYCHYEALQSFGRDPVGAQLKTIPLLTDGSMEELDVHPAYKNFHALDTRQSDWFDKLVQTLGWRMVGRVHKLRFLSTMTEATASETLPEVRVVIECDDERVDEEQDVTLLAERSTLQGTTTVRTRGGLATFADLFLDSAVEATRLVATADGCSAVFSPSFAVKPPRAIAPTRKEVVIPPGEPVFFAGSDAVAVLGSGSARVFDLAGAPRGEPIPLPPSLRFRKNLHGRLFLCGWHGEALSIRADGSYEEWSLGEASGYRIPGDACESGTDILLGFWSGEVYRLAAGGAVQRELHHAGGVQSLAARDGDVFLADLDGQLYICRDGRCVHSMPIDATVRTMKLFADSLVIVGERNMYTLAVPTKRLLDVSLPIGLAAALAADDRIVAVAGDGKGVVIDRRLALQVFHAWPGAVPRSADARGTFCAFRHPDESFSLLHNGRMVLHHPGGALAVSPSGEWVAADDGQAVRLLPSQSLAASAGGPRA